MPRIWLRRQIYIVEPMIIILANRKLKVIRGLLIKTVRLMKKQVLAHLQMIASHKSKTQSVSHVVNVAIMLNVVQSLLKQSR